MHYPDEPGRRSHADRAHGQSAAQTGDVLIPRAAGFGVGDPVPKDVINEYVSLERARNEYGVVIDAATMRIGQAATAEQRSGASAA